MTSVSNNIKTTSLNDPINQTPLRYLSYSNELGAAISEIAPKLGTALWAPTFMYLGADIYDKYKNDRNGYNPSTKRALGRAIFQAISALVALPAIIFAGQKIVSPLSRLGKFRISTNAKDAIIKHTRDIINLSREDIFSDDKKFKENILKSLKNMINSKKDEKKTVSFFRKIINFFTGKYPLLGTKQDKIFNYAENNINKVLQLSDNIRNNKAVNIPKKIYKKYHSLLPKMQELYGQDYNDHALRTVLTDYQNSLIFKNKLLKTLGGFISLIIFSAPVNKYIENTIMEKYVTPEIDQISKNIVNNSHIKEIFNQMEEKNVSSQKTELQPKAE